MKTKCKYCKKLIISKRGREFCDYRCYQNYRTKNGLRHKNHSSEDLHAGV